MADRFDSDQRLLRDIVGTLSAAHGGILPPDRNDSVNTLLRKWAILIALGF